MSVGPGKYDYLCTLVRDKAEAQAVIVIVLGGNKGSGFSVQALSPDMVLGLADVLEDMLTQIREDMKRDLNA